MDRLIARAQELVRKQQRRRIEGITAALATQLSGAEIEVTAGGISVAGKALLRRWLSDPALRFVRTLTR